jgi:hypothetical protein
LKKTETQQMSQKEVSCEGIDSLKIKGSRVFRKAAQA